MDNSYYTGATLIRGSPHPHHHPHHHNPHHPHQLHHHHHHHNHHHHGNYPSVGAPTATTPLAGPPLLMQPRNNKNHLFSGAPLIRNGPQAGTTAVMPVPQPGQGGANAGAVGGGGPPPGVICCFQPVYYVPVQHNPAMHHPPPQPPPAQLALPPPPLPSQQQQQPQTSSVTVTATNNNSNLPIKKKLHNQTTNTTPKRRNYKTLQIPNSSKPGQTPMSTTSTSSSASSSASLSAVSSPTSPTMKTNLHHSLTAVSSLPTTSSSMLTFNRQSYPSQAGSERNSTSSSPVENIYCNSEPIVGQGKHEENELNFQSVIESSRFLLSMEEKQRSDKLLNFYFYDEHWRPREVQSSSSSSSTASSSSSSSASMDHNNSKFQYGPYNSSNNNNSNVTYGHPSSHPQRISSQTELDWLNNNVVDGAYCQENEIEAECKKNFLTYNPQSSGMDSGRGEPVTKATFRLSHTQGNGNDFPHHSQIGTVSPVVMAGGPVGASSATTTTAAAMVIKKKDLEVEAQIVTLANGHRDLEIRLCYVTS